MFYKKARVSTSSGTLSQAFRYTLYLHDMQKLASVPYSSLSN